VHLTRYAMYQDIGRALGGPIGGRVLGVSGMDKFRPLIDPSADMLETTYPEFDLLALPFPGESFDAVITDQVLEHLADPRRAVREANRVLRPGGLAVHTTCFLNPVHPSPRDYFRFSLDGLQALCPPNAQIVRCQAWGNRVALVLLLLRDRTRFIDIPEGSRVRRWLATWNEAKYPIVTWIVMRKRGQHDET
jgi:SAM-dependent methyltransferase